MLQEGDVHRWRGWFPDLLGPSVSVPSPKFGDMNDLAVAYSRASKNDRAQIVRKALALKDGEVQKVADGLGISRSTVWRLGKEQEKVNEI